jgi:hypothetical protein
MDKLSFARTLSVIQATIASGFQLSQFIDVGGMQLRGILLPANWTSCNLSFNCSVVPSTNTPFAEFALTDTTGTLISIPAASSTWIALLPYLTDAVPYVQLSCDATQTSSVIVNLVLEPIYQGIHG